MIGNTANGCLAGLTPEGAALCHRMFSEDVAPEEIDAVDSELRLCLTQGAFDRNATPANTLHTAYLHVTHHCNLQCVGCYSAIDNRNAAHDLPYDELCRIIGQLAQTGVQELIISGGEPFLRDDLVDLCAHASCMGIPDITVLTNGTLLSLGTLQNLSSWVRTVSVSFDGATANGRATIRGTQRFSQLVDAVKLIQSANITAHILPTLHNGNVNDYEAYCKLAEELEVSLSFSLLSISHDDPKAEKLAPCSESLANLAVKVLSSQSPSISISDTPLGSLATRISCGAGQSIVSIAADGTLYPCHMLHRSSYALGNLIENNLTDLLSKGGDTLPQSVDEVAGCSDCEIRYLCGGGCRARAQHAHGDPYGTDPYCSLMRRYYELILAPLSTTIT